MRRVILPKATVPFTILVGVFLSAAVALVAHTTIRRDEARRFEMARQEVEDLVRTRFDRFQNVLFHTRAFLTAKERVSRQDFRAFLQSVDLRRVYPDLLAVGFVERVTAAHRAAHERDVREDGYAGYRVWPRVKGARFLYPIKFIEPFDSVNRKVLGFDVHSEEKRAAAFDRARDTDGPILSEPLALLQDSGQRESPSFLFALPVYQRGLRTGTVDERGWALRGYVYAPFRATEFFTQIHRSSPIFHQGVALRARVGTEVLFDSAQASEGRLSSVSQLPLFGNSWSLEVIATPDFASPADRFAPLALLLAGILMTLLLAWGVHLAKRHDESQRDAIQLRDDFLSICAHELRTPLTSMKLQNQLVQRTLHDDLASGNVARFEKMVQQSGRQIERLVRLVEEMLDISRIRAGKLTLAPEPIELTQLVHDTVERFAPQLQAASCAVRMSLPDSLPGSWDRMRLEQILVNLLSNAIKYGPGKPIDVELLHVGDKAVLSVQDRGIGIAPKNQARIFERFERAATSGPDIGGLGLGLYIVKQILELLGGSIRVESTPGQGSRFTVELPAPAPSASLATLAPVPAPAEALATLAPAPAPSPAHEPPQLAYANAAESSSEIP